MKVDEENVVAVIAYLPSSSRYMREDDVDWSNNPPPTLKSDILNFKIIVII